VTGRSKLVAGEGLSTGLPKTKQAKPFCGEAIAGHHWPYFPAKPEDSQLVEPKMPPENTDRVT